MTEKKTPEKKKDADEIIWPEVEDRVNNVYFEHTRQWKRNFEFVKMLCSMGSVLEWQNGKPGDTYNHFPFRYMVNGVVVEFLPHWGFCKIGGITLAILYSKKDLVAAIKAMNVLKGFKVSRQM